MTDEIIRGDTTIWDIVLTDDDGAPLPLAGATVWVTAKTSPQLPDSRAVWQHTIELDGSGGVVSSDGLSLGSGGASSGMLVEELTPAESATLRPGQTYSIDVQVRLANGRIVTPILGETVTVAADYTHATELA